ncbi:MAG: SDR family NAD(P)-dependent oxidoreductase [Planctomycetes bacterium]|nr:SDR family NAD(P)-dependent oxidoreductase [Planctomycetota bacterium]MBI3833771.1 SDR family NAD(P)-dependent oxidoreductase [Planctomycetota bacterium]
MDLKGKVAVITGGASGIGSATCMKLADEKVKAIAIVDMADQLESYCKETNEKLGSDVLIPFRGDVVDSSFRERVFSEMESRFGVVGLCVPAAGITRDRLAVKVQRDNGSVNLNIYSETDFRRVIDVDLIAPIYWSMRTVASVAMDRSKRNKGEWQPEETTQGAIVMIGSISSAGNRGQISYATAKAGLEGAQATLAKEAIFYGVRCAIIHPGFTDTPMVRAMGERLIHDYILPNTQLRRLIRPTEIAEAICFLLKNSAVSGSLWADAGWHPRA